LRCAGGSLDMGALYQHALTNNAAERICHQSLTSCWWRRQTGGVPMTIGAGNDERRTFLVFEGQWLHGAGLAGLLAGCWWSAQSPLLQVGGLWGLGTPAWYWIAILTAVLHQVYVWLAWRLELHGKGLTRLLGGAAFPAYATGFA